MGAAIHSRVLRLTQIDSDSWTICHDCSPRSSGAGKPRDCPDCPRGLQDATGSIAEQQHGCAPVLRGGTVAVVVAVVVVVVVVVVDSGLAQGRSRFYRVH